MIILSEVATKLQKILNGTDAEVSSIRPVDFQFMVQAQGFHIDNVFDENTHKNFIPVFISSMGGNYNPVPNLKEGSYSIPVDIYFPVRFRDDFFALTDYLVDAFVGRYLTYGSVSGKALSNISVAQYGEIVDLDLKQFKTWAEDQFGMPISITERWMNMSFTLYLSTAGSDYIYGNEASVSLSFKLGNKTYTDTPTFVDAPLTSSSEPASQQILGENESEGLPTATSYGAGFQVYIKNTEFYQTLIDEWFKGNAQTLEMTYTLTFLNKTFTRTCYMQTINLRTTKGQLATLTLGFGKKVNLNA